MSSMESLTVYIYTRYNDARNRDINGAAWLSNGAAWLSW